MTMRTTLVPTPVPTPVPEEFLEEFSDPGEKNGPLGRLGLFLVVEIKRHEVSSPLLQTWDKQRRTDNRQQATDMGVYVPPRVTKNRSTLLPYQLKNRSI